MEEEIKEIKEEGCCGHKHHGKHLHAYCRHRIVRLIIMIFMISLIFTIGFSVGRHSDGRDYSDNFNRGDFNNRGFGRMMGERYNNYDGNVGGGCGFMNNNGGVNNACPLLNAQAGVAGQAIATCPMLNEIQSAPVVTSNTTTAPAKIVVPVK
jgi:hypothetical protein